MSIWGHRDSEPPPGEAPPEGARPEGARPEEAQPEEADQTEPGAHEAQEPAGPEHQAEESSWQSTETGTEQLRTVLRDYRKLWHQVQQLDLGEKTGV